MREEKVTCDGCGTDLTTRSNIEDFRLVLKSESKPGYGSGVYTCMAKYPAVNRAYHFCGLSCLDHWREHEKCFSQSMKKFSDSWREEHGTEITNGIGGKMTSYPCPPDETYKSWTETARTRADEQFPLNSKAA